MPLIRLAALAGVYMMTLPQPAPNLIWWMTALAGTGGLAALCWSGSHRLQAGGLATTLFAALVGFILTIGRFLSRTAT